jgi:transposase-like protein
MLKRWKVLRVIAKSLNNGATITKACDGAGIRSVTLWRWRKQNPKIDAFVEKALTNQIHVVEDALFKRAVGYSYDETTKEKAKSNEGTSEKQIIKIVTKEIAPDVTAQIFYLTNRASDIWKDRRALVNNVNNIKIIQANRYEKVKNEDLDGVLEGYLSRR